LASVIWAPLNLKVWLATFALLTLPLIIWDISNIPSSNCFIFGIHVYILYSSGFTNALKESASMWDFITLKGKPWLKRSSALLVSGFWVGFNLTVFL